MATYKKRGFKPKKEKIVDDIDSIDGEVFDESDSATAEVFNTLDETANKSEKWIEKNSKLLLGLLVGIAALFILYFGYQKFIVEPNENDASDELAYPRALFDKASKLTGSEADSLYNAAIKGPDGKYGFVDIADKYSGTKAGNVANCYAGLSYLKTKQYDKAIEFLSEFKSDDEILGPIALGAIGDAFSDLNQTKEALEYYEKAANKKENNFTAPLFLFKAGQTAVQLKDFKKAEVFFTTIKEKYPISDQGRDIEKYINSVKYADASGVVTEGKTRETTKTEDSEPKQTEIIDNINALYNTKPEFVGKSVKGYEYLGKFVSLKLEDGSELIVLSEGFENGLLSFIKGDAEVDKTSWFNLRRVLFKTGKADLDSKSNNQIDNVVKILKAYPNVNLKLGGYTDNTGNADINKKLSQKRADAILNALINKGITKERLAAEGYGVKHPIADNNTDEGRALNRRVAARVSKK